MSNGLTIHVPMIFQRRGGRKMIVMPHGAALATRAQRSNVDNAIVKALARAFRWQKLLDQGTYGTIKDIAARENIDPSYVSDVLRLNLLAPDIVQMILDGKQPPTVNLARLRQRLSSDWLEQRTLLG